MPPTPVVDAVVAATDTITNDTDALTAPPIVWGRHFIVRVAADQRRSPRHDYAWLEAVSRSSETELMQ